MKAILTGLLVLMLLATTVSAIVEIVEPQLTLDTNYNLFSRNDQTTISVSGSITVRNTDVTNVTVRPAVSFVAGLPSGYAVDALSDINVTAGSTVTIPLAFRLPHRQGSGNTTIGTISITNTATSAQLDTASLIQQTSSMLVMDRLEVDYTDKNDEDQQDEFNRNDQDLKLDKSVAPGTEVTLTFRLENLFDRDYDDDKSTLESIKLTVEADDNDLFDGKFEEEYDLEDLEADKTQNTVIKFTVSPDADVQDYELSITLEGEDGQNAEYKVEKTLTFKVERKSNDLRITKAVITPATITTCDDSASLLLNLKNFGTSNQRDAALAIVNQQLGLNEPIQNIAVEKFSNHDNTFERTVSLDISEAAAGTYPLDITAFIRNDQKIDTERVNLVIGRCPQEQVQPAEETKPPVANVPTTNTAATTATTTASPALTESAALTAETTPLSSSAIVDIVENPYSKEDFVVGMIFVAMAMVLALVVVFLIMLMKK